MPPRCLYVDAVGVVSFQRTAFVTFASVAILVWRLCAALRAYADLRLVIVLMLCLGFGLRL